jgi:hypothetical protein
VVAVSGKPVDTGAEQEVGAGIAGGAEQLIDVALAISNMHEILRLTEQRCRLPQIFQPAIALFLLDRHSRGVDPALESVRSMELLPGPKLDGSQSERKAILGHHQAGMHENSAGRVVTGPTVIQRLLLAHDTDICHILSPIDELRRVVQHQHRRVVRCSIALAGTGKVARQNLLLAHSLVG